jgi:hypothetical protein
MSENVHFDEHMKQQFDAYEPPVPVGMWDRIAEGRARRRRRPVGWWRPFLLLLLLGGVLTGSVIAWQHFSQTDRRVATTTSAVAPVATTKDAPGQETAPASTDGVSPGSPVTAATPAKVNDALSQSPAQPRSNLSPGLSSTPIMDQPNPVTDAPLTLNSSKVLSAAHTTTARKDSPRRDRRSNRAAKANQIADYTEDRSNDPADEALMINTLPTLTSSESQGTTAWVGNRFDSRIDRISPIVPGLPDLQPRLLADLILPGCPKLEEDAAANKTYLELYGGPDMATRSLRSFADSASTSYLQKRKESTRLQSAFSFGLRYTRVFSNGMSLRSGFNYSQINEKFTYTNPNDIRYIIIVTPRQITQPNGTVVTVYDSLRYVQSGTRKKVTYNRYRSIDIPLQLGYEMGNGRWHTNISAGAIINLYSWQRGEVLDANGEPVSITTGKGSAYGFKTNIGVGFLGSVSVYYKLNSRWRLLAEPYFRYNFSPMSNETLNVTQKYNVGGLRLGIRMDL